MGSTSRRLNVKGMYTILKEINTKEQPIILSEQKKALTLHREKGPIAQLVRAPDS